MLPYQYHVSDAEEKIAMAENTNNYAVAIDQLLCTSKDSIRVD